MNERAKLQELIKALEERLHELRLKKARMGFDMPPHDILEMKEIEEKIRELEVKSLGTMVLLPAITFPRLCALSSNN